MYDIKSLRSRTKKNQADFAKWLHIPLKTLQKWEQGVSSPPPYVLELIENKIFYTYMVASPVLDQTDNLECFQSAPSSPAPSAKDVIQALEEESAIEIQIMSKACIYAPEHGGCVKCPHADDDSDYCFRLSSWKRYKEFSPD